MLGTKTRYQNSFDAYAKHQQIISFCETLKLQYYKMLKGIKL
jgi:hypothetical protein